MSKARLAGLVAMLSVLSDSASAGPFDGRWALAEDDCRLEAGTSDRVPVTIAGNRVDFYESTCEIDAMEAIGEQESAWHVTRTCRGEGETRTVRSIFAVDRGMTGALRQLIEIDLDDGYVVVRQRCD